MLYGNKSSGKTYLATKILNSVLGKDNYISIKCIFASDRKSLLYLIGDEMVRLFKSLDSNFWNQPDNEKDMYKLTQESTIESWIRNINRFIKIN